MQPPMQRTETGIDGEDAIYEESCTDNPVATTPVVVIGEENTKTSIEPDITKQEDLHRPTYMNPAKIEVRRYILKK